MIGIINYGVGNLQSMKNSLDFLNIPNAIVDNPKEIQKFDKIILSNVLEHIKDRVEFLKQMRKLSGVILLRVPLITRDWLAVYKKELGREYRLDRTHFIEYSLEELRDECVAGGWQITDFSIQFGEFWGVFLI